MKKWNSILAVAAITLCSLYFRTSPAEAQFTTLPATPPVTTLPATPPSSGGPGTRPMPIWPDTRPMPIGPSTRPLEPEIAENLDQNPTDIQLTAVITAPGQTVRVNKYFANAHTINWWDGSAMTDLTIFMTKTYASSGTYTITLALTGGTTRWTFGNYSTLVPKAWTTASNVYVSHMPDLSFFGDSTTSAGSNFFYRFNYQGSLTNLPSWSFDTSNITTVGNYFFHDFNYGGSLTSLPIWSFDTSKITVIGNSFFWGFNDRGSLTTLPTWSFNTSQIISVGNDFFYSFNGNGSLTSLPTWSFQLNSWLITVPNSFFYGFNRNGSLTSLPIWSFDTSNLTTVGNDFFYLFNYKGSLTSLPNGSFQLSSWLTTARNWFFSSFNSDGKLTSLPSWSFDTSKITTVGDRFFASFNQWGKLASLPTWSFNTSNISGTVGINFFYGFNRNGSFTSLPSWSFDTSNLTTVGDVFFSDFNNGGSLTSLPTWSFDTSHIRGVVWNYFFDYFNYNGALTSLPEWSFDTSNISTVGNNFFERFNHQGALTNLPSSFKRPALDTTNASKAGNFFNAFNSPLSTLNRNAADIINGGATPSSNRATFSPNQPGLCDVHDNRKANLIAPCTPAFNPAAIQLTAVITAPGQTVRVNKYFANAHTIDWGDGTATINHTADTTHIYASSGNYIITLALTGGATRWGFMNYFWSTPLVPKYGTTASDIYVSYMPDLSLFGISTHAGFGFFQSFNHSGALTSLPSWSLDTSNLTTVGEAFFRDFNNNGALTSLPAWSFDTSQIASARRHFFYAFNSGGSLTSLPEWSFDISKFTSTLEGFFYNFNAGGSLTSLPAWSFDTSNITAVYGGMYDAFFVSFNQNGSLTSLPSGSFQFSSWLTEVWGDFFPSFNAGGALTSLPEWSFNTHHIAFVQGAFFDGFNAGGALTSLPSGSFRISSDPASRGGFNSFNRDGSLISLPEWSFDTSNLTSLGGFNSFNQNGALTSLPTWSFDTSNATRLNGFNSFNQNGALTSLPAWSFNTSKVVNEQRRQFASLFNSFNESGSLTSLPEWSFDTSNITSILWSFFKNFNYNGKITTLPSSFKRPTNCEFRGRGDDFENAFNSPLYTLNRNAADIINGGATPSSNRATFSDNQPGLCDVHDNRKVTPGTCTPPLDITIPIITLLGDNPQTLKIYGPYRELGAERGDDGLTGEVTDIDTWSLDVTMIGDYTVTYRYTDGGGNTGTGERTVTVIDRDPPFFLTDGPDWPETEYFTGEYTKRTDTSIELHIDAEASMLLQVLVDGQALTPNVAYTVTGDTIISYLSEFLDTLAAQTYTTAVSFSNGFLEQGALVIKEWEQIPVPPPPAGESGGGGWWYLSPDHCPDGDFSPSYYDGECGTPKHGSEKPEAWDSEHGAADNASQAFSWAREHNLTSMPTYESFKPNDKITRAEMAKVVSLYAESLMSAGFSLPTLETPSQWQDMRGECAFTDLHRTNPELQSYIIQACELGLMGYFSDGTTQKSAFNPLAPVSQAEVAVIISRMLRWDANRGSEKWRYHNHLLALRKRGIIEDDSDPLQHMTREAVFQTLMNIIPS